MARLSRSDLEAVLDFAGEVAESARQPERQVEHLLARVARLVDVELVLYGRLDSSLHRVDSVVLGDPGPPPSPELPDALRSDENAYRVYAARTRQPYFRATRLFDLVHRRAFERTRLYQLIPFADAPSTQMRMPAHDGSWWQLEMLRPGREFGDRDLSLLDAVRPLLELYEDRWELARKLAAVRAAPPDTMGASRLSAREQEVLDRVADGASNQDIADALHISPGTVRKHLENIYAKLEVTSRTAALARTGRTRVADPEGSSSPT